MDIQRYLGLGWPTLSLYALVTTSQFAHAQPTSAKDASPSALTQWSSAPCTSLALGPGKEISHLRRLYLLRGDTHVTRYHFFIDTKCTLPLFSFHLSGRALLGSKVSSLIDTREVNVYFDRVLFTADAPEAIALASQCADGKFEVGVQRDVTETGCLFLKPKAQCGIDHDLVQIRKGVLTPGFRTGDMCKPAGRPTRLQSIGARLVPSPAATNERISK
jgi:hypothetical protein